MDAVSYQVLGYLLLGVFIIYSKKEEYLLTECDEVLLKINKFEIQKLSGNKEIYNLALNYN